MLLQNGFYNPDITHDTRALRISQEENEKSFINIHRIYKEIQNGNSSAFQCVIVVAAECLFDEKKTCIYLECGL